MDSSFSVENGRHSRIDSRSQRAMKILAHSKVNCLSETNRLKSYSAAFVKTTVKIHAMRCR